jgi:hypothetical protein
MTKHWAPPSKRRAFNSTLPARSLPIPRARPGRGRGRKPAETERIYGPTARREWVKSQPCAVSGQRGQIVQAHAKGGGIARKADAEFVLPLLRTLHDELHQHGVKTFEAKYRVNLLALAALTEAKWQHYLQESRNGGVNA